MKTKIWKRILPFFMSIVMLFSAVAGVLPVMAEEMASATVPVQQAPEESTGEDAYFRIVFEDGVLRLQLNPQKVYEMLKDKTISRDELLKFIPEEIANVLKQGKDISLDDLKALVSEYITPAELKELLPMDVISKYFSLDSLMDLIAIDDLLSVISLDEVLAEIDPDALAALITPEVLDLLLENEAATDAVLNQTFIRGLLETEGFVDEILATPGLKDRLAKLVDKTIVDKILADYPNVTDTVIGEIDSSELAAIFDSEAGTSALKNYFSSHKTEVSNFLTAPAVIDRIKGDLVKLEAVRNVLLNKDVIKAMIDPTTGVINKDDIRALFTDEQLKSLISNDVINATVKSDDFINKVLADNALLSKIASESLINSLAGSGYLNGRIDPEAFITTSPDWNQLKATLGITKAEQDALADALFDEAEIEAFAEQFYQTYGREPSEEEIFNHFKSSITVNDIFTVINSDLAATNADVASLKTKFAFSNLFDKGIIKKDAVMNNDTVKNVIKALLNEGGAARELIVSSIASNPELTVGDYWAYVDFGALTEQIDTQLIINMINEDETLYTKITNIVTKAENTEKFTAIFKNSLSEDLCLSILQDNSDLILDKFTVDELLVYFDRNAIIDEIVTAFGGYYAFIEKKYVSEDTVIEAIGGHGTLLDYLDLGVVSDIVLEMVAPSTLLAYVDFNDVVGAAGGYGSFFGLYSNEELQAIFTAIGTDKLRSFITESGLLQKLNLKQIATDLFTMLKENGTFDTLSAKVRDSLLTIINTEIESIYLNDTEIGHWGIYNLEAMVAALLQAIPDVQHFLDMKEGDALVELILSVKMAESKKIYSVGFAIEFIGDFTQVQTLVEAYADSFVFDVSDELEITISTTLPAVTAEIYKKLLLSDRIPATLKQKLLTAPQSMSIAELSDFLLEIPDEDLQKIADTVTENVEKIRAKVEPKLEAALGANAEKLEAAKLKLEQILEIFQSVEKLKSARATIVAFVHKLPASLVEQSLASLYRGEGSFHLSGSFEKNLYGRVLALLQKANLSESMAENLLLPFNNDLTIDGSIGLTVNTTNIYQLTVVDEAEELHVFYLPAGFELANLSALFPSLASAFEEIAVMPAEDTQLGVKVWYTVEFYLDGELIDTVGYWKGTVALDPSLIPTFTDRAGYYTPEWPTIRLNQQEVTRVYASYVRKPHQSTVSDQDFGVADFELYYDVKDTVLHLPLPTTAPHGYTFDTWYIDVNKNGVVDKGDIRLERIDPVSAYRVRRTALQTADFRVPDGVTLTEDMQLIGAAYLTQHTITFVDENGALLPTDGEVTYTVEDNRDEIEARFPQLPAAPAGYTAVWYVGEEKWSTFDYYTADAEIQLSVKMIPNDYTVTFKDQNGNVLSNTDGDYTVEDPSITTPDLPTNEGYTSAWYVVSVNGTPLETPVLWAGYMLSTGDLVVQAIDTPITYEIIFKDGDTETKYYFNIRDQILIDAQGTPVSEPAISEVAGYTASWVYDLSTIGNKIVTPTLDLVWYEISFTDGADTAKLYFNIIEQKLYDAPNGAAVAEPTFSAPAAGYTRAWTAYDLSLAQNQAVTTVDTPITYEIVFKDGDTETKYYFNIRDQILVDAQASPVSEPAISEVAGYTASWVYDLSVPGNKTVTPTRELVWYEISFVDGSNTTTLYFNVVDQKLYDAPNGAEAAEPTFSAPAAGYNRAWTAYDLSLTEKQTVTTVDTIITYVAIFKDANGQEIASVSYTVNGFLGTLPTVPQKNGYDAEWNYTLPLPLGGTTISPTYTAKKYDVYFYNPDGSIAGTAKYETDTALAASKIPAAADRTEEGYTDPVWYVVKANGQSITPVKLSDYTFTYGAIEVEARYTAITYTATFYDADGNVYLQIPFTVESGLTLPELPAKAGYTGAWSYDGLKAENLQIRPTYTAIQYTATFVGEDGEVLATITFTVNDTKLAGTPTVPAKTGMVGHWYVTAENGTALATAVLLDEYTLRDANITIAPRYNMPQAGDQTEDKDETPPVIDGGDTDEPTKGGLGWLWWILIVLLIIFLILVALWILNKKNLPPFTNPKIKKLAKYLKFLNFLNVFFKPATPIAIVEAAMPAIEPVELPAEEIAPQIEIVESIDVQTADQAMTDTLAMALVETVEVAAKAQGQKAIVNLQSINDAFDADDTVNLETLKAKKLIPAKAERVKVLATGTLTKPLTVEADAFSVQAIKMITLTGGHAVQKKYQA